ncbi:hypothetical protein V498_06465 [Pseudogymnoascus sp. VKM F-4517 (FW-2822)]|nr:hypothetical protein V498_06465 [Pseudogymnoascus sp. VKM F-4517 (FW-2822)]
MDMSRGNFSLVLFSKPFYPIPGPKHFTMILGGTTCTWRKEIKPYQAYELWTRVLSWDDKWLYVVTHFVSSAKFRPEEYVMQPWKGKPARKEQGEEKNNKRQEEDEVDKLKAVFASSVARYVFKNNRRTIPPEEVLARVGLLPSDEVELAGVERLRVKGLPIGKLEAGWDAVHGSFEPGAAALGWYNSAY